MTIEEEHRMFFNIAVDALREILELVAPILPPPNGPHPGEHPEAYTDLETRLMKIWDAAIETGFFG